MAKFKYVGDPNDRFSGPDVAVAHGQTFVKNETVTVDDDATVKHRGQDVKVVDRLRGNSHFVDLSDKDTASDVEKRKKALEKQEADAAKAADAQRKADEADEKERQANLAKAQRRGDVTATAATAPRPPGNVTREPVTDPFGGRTVEQRTRQEDHTKSGKTKGNAVPEA